MWRLLEQGPESQSANETVFLVMASDLSATEGISPSAQSWPWWPLLPLKSVCLQWFRGGEVCATRENTEARTQNRVSLVRMR